MTVPQTSPVTGTGAPAAAVAARGVGRTYRDQIALSDVDFTFDEPGVYGLLGRNGAGKTTLMRILTGQDRPSSGSVRILGEDPFENEAVQQQICFIKESQCYSEDLRVRDVLTAAGMLYPHWDADCADELVDVFELPRKRQVKKLSRGMTSALGIAVGIAARAPVTFFDEPYLGLDATARQVFYDRLLADIAERPRAIVLSTHLIDEIANLLEHVVVLDHGRVLIDADADSLRDNAARVTGPSSDVDTFVGARRAVQRTSIGGSTSATVLGIDPGDRARALDLHLDLAPVSLQQLVIATTTDPTTRQEAVR